MSKSLERMYLEIMLHQDGAEVLTLDGSRLRVLASVMMGEPKAMVVPMVLA